MTIETQLRKQLDDSMPDIISAMHFEQSMYRHEIAIVTRYGVGSRPEQIHLAMLNDKLNKITALLGKIESN